MNNIIARDDDISVVMYWLRTKQVFCERMRLLSTLLNCYDVAVTDWSFLILCEELERE